jgi:hypothetical protein
LNIRKLLFVWIVSITGSQFLRLDVKTAALNAYNIKPQIASIRRRSDTMVEAPKNNKDIDKT